MAVPLLRVEGMTVNVTFVPGEPETKPNCPLVAASAAARAYGNAAVDLAASSVCVSCVLLKAAAIAAASAADCKDV